MGSLRIIAGTLKGRRIAVAPGLSIRPTADRVREALFSILGADVEGARVLDAYSGSGALGFEALSRGAARAVFLEADRRAVAALRDNAERFAVSERCTVLQGPVCDLLSRGAVQGPHDLVLADPPYAAGESGRFLPLVSGQLAPEGLLVVERDRRESPPDPAPSDLQRFRTATYGRSSLDFYRRAAEAPAG